MKYIYRIIFTTILVLVLALTVALAVGCRPEGLPESDKGEESNPFTVTEAYYAIKKMSPNRLSDRTFFVIGRVYDVAEEELTLYDPLRDNLRLHIPSAEFVGDMSELKEEDCVLISGRFMLYQNSAYNSAQIMNATLADKYASGTEKNPLTATEAFMAAYELGYDAYSDKPVYVRGTVTGEVVTGEGNTYRFDIRDSVTLFTLTVYYAAGDRPQEGDTVTLYGYLYNYHDSVYEMKSYSEQDLLIADVFSPRVSRITLSLPSYLENGRSVKINVATEPAGYEGDVDLFFDFDRGYARLDGDSLTNVNSSEYDGFVTVRAELDGVTAEASVAVWSGTGTDSRRTLNYSQAAERIDNMPVGSVSDNYYYVSGVVASLPLRSDGGYDFELRDIDYDLRIAVSDAVFDSDVDVDGVRRGDSVTVRGKLCHGANGELELVGGCTVESWRAENAVFVDLTVSAATIKVGEEATFYVSTDPTGYEQFVKLEIVFGDCGTLEGRTFFAEKLGTCVIYASLNIDGTYYTSQGITLKVVSDIEEEVTVTLAANKYFIEYSDNTFVYADVQPAEYVDWLTFEITDGRDVASLVGSAQTQRSVYPLDKGFVTIVAKVGDYVSNAVTIQIVRDDPYTNIGASGFYNNNYKPAADLEDSYWRTKHNLMSGDISDQDQAPTLAQYRPKQNGKFVRNSDENYFDNGNSYKVVDFYGNVVNTVYKFGAYVSLEEVAAYVYAYGDVPANYSAKKSVNPTSSPWGKYLRLNNSSFSGDTSRYPYEPVLPNISGCGGTYRYYEIDIGTTGTDCDPSYSAKPYNDGSYITRGAARIVYARYDGNGDLLTPSERYVFYTYNHYNDFCEYLNYSGGWGETFGNITGGGQISSSYNCNPTPYVEVARSSFGCK